MTEGDSTSRNFRSAYYEKLGFCENDEKNYLDLLIASSPFDQDKLNELCERFELDRKCIEAWKILLGVECGRKNPFDEYANVRRVRSEHFQMLKHHLEVLLRHNLVIKDRGLNCSKRCELSKPRKPTKANNSHANSHDHHQHLHQHQHEPQEQQQEQEQQQQQQHEQHQQERQQHSQENANLITLMYLLETGQLDTLDIDSQLKSEESRKLLVIATLFVSIADNLQEAFFLFRNFTNLILNKSSPQQ